MDIVEFAFFVFFVLSFDASLMVYFRKRLTPEILGEINELIIRRAQEQEESSGDEGDSDDGDCGNGGTLIVDATCAPSDIRYPKQYILNTHTMNTCILCVCDLISRYIFCEHDLYIYLRHIITMFFLCVYYNLIANMYRRNVLIQCTTNMYKEAAAQITRMNYTYK